MYICHVRYQGWNGREGRQTSRFSTEKAAVYAAKMSIMGDDPHEGTAIETWVEDEDGQIVWSSET